MYVAATIAAFACANSAQDATEEDSDQEALRATPSGPAVDDFKITILSDMVIAYGTTAEWGFSALVEATKAGVTKRFLFDTGAAPQTVIANAKSLGVDLCSIEDVVLSHNHNDHTMGLNTLRSTCKTTNPKAFINAYVGGEEIFYPRRNPDGTDDNVMAAEKTMYEAQGGRFIVRPTAGTFLLPGVWLTGKITRTHDEKTYPGEPNYVPPGGAPTLDTIPEEHSIVIHSGASVVVLTGCAHAGIINTIEQSKRIVGGNHTVAVAGGIHLFGRPLGNDQTEGDVRWFAKKMRQLRVNRILGAHCTGFERINFLRSYLNLDASKVAISTIGTIFNKTDGFVFQDLNATLQ
jgi:7,8-dihydropterin-6-yl-methyl-4-(beta-D-ribofuranosyl)aminobenzene 5'-phosphate synthase